MFPEECSILTDLNPVRPGIWRPLHEEKLTGRAVRISLHHHCPVGQMWEKDRRDVSVILNQVAFRDSQFGPERLLKISELDDATVNLQFQTHLILWDLYRAGPVWILRARGLFES